MRELHWIALAGLLAAGTAGAAARDLTESQKAFARGEIRLLIEGVESFVSTAECDEQVPLDLLIERRNASRDDREMLERIACTAWRLGFDETLEWVSASSEEPSTYLFITRNPQHKLINVHLTSYEPGWIPRPPELSLRWEDELLKRVSLATTIK